MVNKLNLCWFCQFIRKFSLRPQELRKKKGCSIWISSFFIVNSDASSRFKWIMLKLRLTVNYFFAFHRDLSKILLFFNGSKEKTLLNKNAKMPNRNFHAKRLKKMPNLATLQLKTSLIRVARFEMLSLSLYYEKEEHVFGPFRNRRKYVGQLYNNNTLTLCL